MATPASRSDRARREAVGRLREELTGNSRTDVHGENTRRGTEER